jgi:hypothetical protein
VNFEDGNMAQQPVASTICPKRLEFLKSKLKQQGLEETDASRRAEEILTTANKLASDSAYLNPDGTFKGGFEGCVQHMMSTKGLPEENARKLCAYIGRQAGKIP